MVLPVGDVKKFPGGVPPRDSTILADITGAIFSSISASAEIMRPLRIFHAHSVLAAAVTA
jgi:hypothetical protein